MLKYIFTLILLIFCNNTLAAEDYHKVIADFAKSYAKEQLLTVKNEQMSINAATIDKRIKLTPCQGNLSAKFVGSQNHQRAATVLVTCEQASGWQLYVPLRIKRMVPVVISERPLSKGDILTDANTRIALRDSALLRAGYISDLAFVKGARLKRQLAADQLVLTRHICLVCKGENVTISSSVGNLTVKTDGVALGSGVLGKKINVRNSKSRRIVSGTVKAPGLIVIQR